MVRRELHIYIYLQQSTFKKRQIYAKIYLYIYLGRIKDTVWAYFLKNDIIQLCIFPYKTCNWLNVQNKSTGTCIYLWNNKYFIWL